MLKQRLAPRRSPHSGRGGRGLASASNHLDACRPRREAGEGASSSVPRGVSQAQLLCVMEDLIAKINQVQDLTRKLGVKDKKDLILDIPRIVAIGSQSSGKSSVLESLVGHSILPRGKEMVTRCPLELRMHHLKPNDPRPEGGHEEWGVFGHCPEDIFQMTHIKDEIERRTDEVAPGKSINKEAIVLDVYSAKVPDLTLIDTPGIVKVATNDQDKSIPEQIMAVVDFYINNEKTIILVVHPADTDLANCEALQLAQEDGVDPKGDRTLMVITKLDKVDEGTDARDMLTGTTISVKLGIIGVKNRSAKETQDGKELQASREDEEKFLKQHYPALHSQHGTRYLSSTLCNLLNKHIKKCMPDLKAKAAQQISENKALLKDCGEAISDKDQKSFLYQIVPEFAENFRTRVAARTPSLEDKPLTGGAKICFHFGTLRRNLLEVNPCEKYSVQQVKKVIADSSGPRPPYLISEVAFEALVRPLIKDMLQPCLDTVSNVMEQLAVICADSIPSRVKERFPAMEQKIMAVVQEVIHDYSLKTIEMVTDSVKIEKAHVSYNNLTDIKKESTQVLLSDAVPRDDSIPFKNVPQSMKTEELKEVLILSDEDKKQIVTQGKMLVNYYEFVARKVADTTEKSIMKYLVQRVKKCLQVQLVDQLSEGLDSLLKEDEDVSNKRKLATKRLQTLVEVMKVLSSA